MTTLTHLPISGLSRHLNSPIDSVKAMAQGLDLVIQLSYVSAESLVFVGLFETYNYHMLRRQMHSTASKLSPQTGSISSRSAVQLHLSLSLHPRSCLFRFSLICKAHRGLGRKRNAWVVRVLGRAGRLRRQC